jgi:hypothetical protein
MSEIDLTILRGDTYLARLTISRDGAAADLTGATLKMMIKPDAMTLDANATLSLTTSAGLTVIDALSGIVDVELTPAQTDDLKPGKIYVWDFQVRESGGRVFTACGGTVKISTDVVLATS